MLAHVKIFNDITLKVSAVAKIATGIEVFSDLDLHKSKLRFT